MNKFESLQEYKFSKCNMKAIIGGFCTIDTQTPTNADGGDTLHTQYINREDGKGFVVSGYHTTRGGFSSIC